MRIEDSEILIRDLSEGDLPLLLKWLTDDRVLEYYEGRDVGFTMDTPAVLCLATPSLQGARDTNVNGG